MRIGFDAKRAFNNNSGLGNYSRYIIDSAQRLSDDELYLFTPKTEAQHLSKYQGKESINLQLPAYKNKIYGAYWRSKGQVKDFEKLDLDVFHGLSNELPMSISKSKVGKVVTVHDLIFLRFPELYKPLDRKIYQKKFFQACSDADKIVAISQQTKKDIVDFFQIEEKKIDVIYQDCDVQFHQEIGIEQQKEVQKKYDLYDEFVVSVGTIEPRKNQLQILKALRNEDIPVVLVGRKTPYQDDLQKFVDENGMQNRVKFINGVKFSELPAIFELAKVFAYPSIFEGFGIPIIEAQNQGTAVVTSTGSCFAETGGEAALYANPNSIDELKTHLIELWSNDNFRTELEKQGKENALRFRSENTFPQLHQIYKSL